MKWWQISTILCTYGFLKEFRPSEPFISPYLTSFKNFTIEEVNQKIYPFGTYCYLSLLVPIFLLTDFLRYKAILVTGGIAAVITWSLLIFGTTIQEMQVVEFFYGLFMASEVAYYTYIYAKVDKKHYQKVTSHTRAAFLLGKASAGLSSQLFVVYNVLDYLELNYLTVFSVGAATLLAIILPSVPQSVYFHRQREKSSFESQEDNSPDWNDVKWKNVNGSKFSNEKCLTAFSALYSDFKEAFTNSSVLQWSIWWSLATCGYLQAISYVQLLWENIVQDNSFTLYHGYVEFGSSILGAAVAFGIGYLKISWNLWGEISLGFLTICQGGILLYSAYLTNLYVSYLLFVIYQLFYQAAITVATYEVAKFINEDSYALVFGINTFTALGVQTILTVVVVDTLEMNIRNQFKIYGGYHFFIGCGFLIAGIFTIIKSVKGQTHK